MFLIAITPAGVNKQRTVVRREISQAIVIYEFSILSSNNYNYFFPILPLLAMMVPSIGAEMDMQRLREEARTFGSEKQNAVRHASQVAAMQLTCGIDLSASLLESGEAQARLIQRIERMIERERLKGMRRHWSYDLNRHIALKQVLDRLRQLQAGEGEDAGRSERNARASIKAARRRH